MDLEVEIAWNLTSWSKTAFWAIVIALPRGTPGNGEFLHLDPENCNFAVYSNICSLNYFLLKSQNKVPLVLEQPLKYLT